MGRTFFRDTEICIDIYRGDTDVAVCEFSNVEISEKDGGCFTADLALNASGGDRYLFDCSYDIENQSLNLTNGRRADGKSAMDGELGSIIRFHIFMIIDAIQYYLKEHSDK